MRLCVRRGEGLTPNHHRKREEREKLQMNMRGGGERREGANYERENKSRQRTYFMPFPPSPPPPPPPFKSSPLQERNNDFFDAHKMPFPGNQKKKKSNPFGEKRQKEVDDVKEEQTPSC